MQPLQESSADTRRDSPVVDLSLSYNQEQLLEPSSSASLTESTLEIANDVTPLAAGVSVPSPQAVAHGRKSFFGMRHKPFKAGATVLAHEKSAEDNGTDIRIDVKSGSVSKHMKHRWHSKKPNNSYQDNKESKPAQPKGKWFGKHTFFKLNKQRIVRRHVGYSYARNWFHTMLTLKWYWQLLSVFSMYFLINATFALLYFSGGPGAIRNFEEGSWDYLWLSVQTLTTVGYGRLEPKSAYLQVIASIEATLGIVILAITSGLAFSIIARPSSAVMFSNMVVVEPETVSSAGRRLHFRISNLRETAMLYDTQMQVMFGWMVVDHINGGIKWELKSLTLESSGYSPNINVGQSYYHIITADSPLFGIKTSAWLKNHRARMSCVLICHDNDWATTTASHKVYQADDIMFNHLFVNVSTPSDEYPGAYYLEYNNFHRTKDFGAIINKLFDLLDTDRNESISREELQNFARNPPKAATEDLRFDADRLLMHFDELASLRSARVKAPNTLGQTPQEGEPTSTAGTGLLAGGEEGVVDLLDMGGVDTGINTSLNSVNETEVEIEEWDMALTREDFIRGVMLMRKEQFDQRQIGQIET